ncbi:MAG: hypothetical protein AAF685_15950 [Cyanobacteria bacterium P01_C01_bin.89]
MVELASIETQNGNEETAINEKRSVAMGERRSPEMFPWASSSTKIPRDSDGSANPVPTADTDRPSLDLPNFNPPVTSAPTTARHASTIPQYTPPVPPQSATQRSRTMGDGQAQRLSDNLRQRTAPDPAASNPARHPAKNRFTTNHRRRNRQADRRPLHPIGRDRPKRRRSQWQQRRFTSPLQRPLNRLDRLFRGKVLLWIFGAWAVFWLVGGIALVGLLNADSSSVAPGSFTAGSASRSNLSQQSQRSAESFPVTAPMIEGSAGQNSSPPILPVAIALIICFGGGWLKLQQLRSGS